LQRRKVGRGLHRDRSRWIYKQLGNEIDPLLRSGKNEYLSSGAFKTLPAKIVGNPNAKLRLSFCRAILTLALWYGKPADIRKGMFRRQSA
jgi:hypothetical protein